MPEEQIVKVQTARSRGRKIQNRRRRQTVRMGKVCPQHARMKEVSEVQKAEFSVTENRTGKNEISRIKLSRVRKSEKIATNKNGNSQKR